MGPEIRVVAAEAAVPDVRSAGAPGPGARTAVFAQLSDVGRAEQVAQRLSDAIVLGVLAPGERLPSEAELARRFGVAVVTARDGLQALREAGMVQTRRGRDGGSFVIDTGVSDEVLLEVKLRRLARVELSDLALYFAMIAASCAEQAAERTSEAEHQKLTSWLEAADFSSASAARRNVGGFYLEIAVLSQSSRLVREQIRLQAEFGPLIWLGLADDAGRGIAVATLRAVSTAIALSDADQARRLVRQQIRAMSEGVLAAKARLERGKELK